MAKRSLHTHATQVLHGESHVPRSTLGVCFMIYDTENVIDMAAKCRRTSSSQGSKSSNATSLWASSAVLSCQNEILLDNTPTTDAPRGCEANRYSGANPQTSPNEIGLYTAARISCKRTMQTNPPDHDAKDHQCHGLALCPFLCLLVLDRALASMSNRGRANSQGYMSQAISCESHPQFGLLHTPH